MPKISFDVSWLGRGRRTAFFAGALLFCLTTAYAGENMKEVLIYRNGTTSPYLEYDAPHVVHGRQLQATSCTPSTANGVWSGTPPDLTICGKFYWTGYGNPLDVQASTTWTLSCNNGFARYGSAYGTCTGTKTCSYNPAEGYAGSCSFVCTYTMDFYSWTTCIYCCKCSNAYSFSSEGGQCRQCVPPAAANAVNPSTTLGTATYTWTCQRGYYGTPVSRTCQSLTDGAGNPVWSGSAISCALCSAPAAPAAGYSIKDASNPDTWYVGCNDGYHSSTTPAEQVRVCSTTNGVMSGVSPTCAACGVGNYCSGGVRTLCPAGRFGAPTATTLTSSACSGTCLEGYFCGAGSTSSTQNACGAIDVYCPAGSGAPVAVTANYYTTPTTAPANLRTGQSPCPAHRACSGGVILPGIDMSDSCPLGRASASVEELLTNADFGPLFTVTTLGYTGSMTWTINSITSPDATCALTAANITMSSYTGAGRLRVASWPLDYPRCMNGFTVSFTAARSNDPSLSASCQVAVDVLQVAKPPIISDCGMRSVNERSIAGTNVGTPLNAINLNLGTSLLWFLDYTTSGNVPFSIGMCDGQVRVLKPMNWRDAASYRLDLTVRNDGSALGIGSRTSTCTTWVNITMVPIPPQPTVTSFFLPELSPVGTFVGNIRGQDPNNFTFNCSWGMTDTPNAFAIDRWCNITVIQQIDTLNALKSVFTYKLNMTNGWAQSTTPITINLLPIPRPPVTSDQSREIRDDAVVNTQLTPALIASHQQALNLTFSLSSGSPFSITPSGMLYLNTGGVLNYNIRSTYVLAFVVTDTNGQTATAQVTIRLTESNRSPAFLQGGVFSFVVDEGADVGASLSGAQTLQASDPNPRDVLTYTLVAASPSTGLTTFSLNPFTGIFTLGGSALARTNGRLVFDEAQTYPVARTFRLNVSVVDSGVPPLRANGTVWVEITNIRPRVAFTAFDTGSYSIASNISASALITDISALTWSAYSRSHLRYALSAETTATGDKSFVIDAMTGLIRVANVSFMNQQNVTVWGAPKFDFNTKNSYTLNVTVSDAITTLTTTVKLTVMLNHINRAPRWAVVPRMFAKALHSGSIGSPLIDFVEDPDRLVATVKETFTFTILSGNIDSTFGIDSSNGQLFVAKNNTPSFDLTNPASVNMYNISVMVKDAGINGPSYNSTTVVQVKITDANLPPSIGFHNLTVNELVPAGTIVGYVQGIDQEAVSRLTYFISPAGPNINQPFPFNITTVSGGTNNYGRGRIDVIDDGPIDWNNRFKVYQAILTVRDNDATTPLTGSGSLQINVNWVPKPPFFNPNRQPSSRSFVISVNEKAKPGTNISSDGLLAASKDPWETPKLRYRWLNAGALGNIFAVHPVTAAVTMAPNAPLLQFNDQQQYTLTLFVNDTNGLNDTATVVINILDINDPATFTGLGDASNITVPSGSSLVVAENATVGTVFGYVRAQDLDRNHLWGQMKFRLVQTSDAFYFAIDERTGALSVARSGIDFWDQTRFLLNVSVTDGDFFDPITVYAPVWVNITQVNTVAVVAFAAPPGTPAVAGFNVSSTAFAGQYPSVDVLVSSRGISSVYVIGRGFGRTARRLAADGAVASSTAVTASYGLTGVEHTASCVVLVPNTVLNCSMPAGIGAGHVWRINIGKWQAVSVRMTGYIPPSISRITRVGANNTDAVNNLLSTRGIHSIEVAGDNFGAVGTDVSLTYGQLLPQPNLGYTSPRCTVQAPGHSLLVCTTMEGIGANLGFRATVGSQHSTVFFNTLVRYEPPQIATVAAPLLDTEGGQLDTIRINGTGFGPVGTANIVVSYSIDAEFNSSRAPVFVASGCYVSPLLPHAQLLCTSAAGIGSSLRVTVNIGGQQSTVAPVGQVVSYKRPQILNIGGLGANQASTEGGQQIIISGAQFGLVTPLDNGGFPIAGPLQPRARYGAYVPGQPLRYAAASCRVSVANSQILCQTAPGTGKNLVWQVSVGEQDSDIFFNQTTNYGPPIVASYSGAGAANAFTWGDQVVRISGSNFGPAGTVIQSATYGSDVNGTDFTARNCTLVVPHAEIECLTDVGAGKGLSWFVVIDDQRSVSPSTAYGRPVITGFSGTGSMDASTDGGDTVVVHGSWFSTDKYVNSVTYGPSGIEYRAQGCHLTVNHTEIACLTQPGVGRKLKWIVTVGGQSNDLTTDFTSYAYPQIQTMSPLNGPTNGGTQVTITGTDFAINFPAAQVVVKINNLRLDTPSSSDIQSHWTALYAGEQGLPNVARWMNELTTLRPTSVSTISKSQHRLTVLIPEGFGPNCELFVLVNGIPSNIHTFTYQAPHITNAAPDRQNVSMGYLRVYLEGTSFCNGRLNCGEVRVNGDIVTVREWTHNSVMFVMPDPSGGGANSLAVISVAGVPSNAFPFRKPVPNISNRATQLPWRDMDTNGNQILQIFGVMDIGTEPVSILVGTGNCDNVTRSVSNDRAITDSDAEFTVSCITPAGVGSNLPIIITSLGGSSRADPNFVFSYAPPKLDTISLFDARRLQAAIGIPDGIPTLGANVTIHGSFLGNPTLQAAFGGSAILLLDDAIALPLIEHTQSYIRARIPTGDGTNHWLRVIIGSQPSVPIFFLYSVPSVLNVSPSIGPTMGGTLITLTGHNFGISTPNITINGRWCRLFTPYVPTPLHDTIKCYSPAGQDRDHAVRVIVNGQQSSQDASRNFSYLPPTVASVIPSQGPTSGYSDTPVVSQSTFTPTNRIRQHINGHNFGEAGQVSFEPFEDSDPLSTIITVPQANILTWNHTTIGLYLPAGFGDRLRVVVTVGSQSSRQASDVSFSYDAPVVLNVTRHDRTFTDCVPREQCFRFGNITRCKISPAGCYDTIGDFPLRVVGANFGPQDLLGLSTTVSIGGRRCARDDRFDQSHNILVCAVPRGFGDRNLVFVRVGSRSSAPSEGAYFAYDPPFITAIMPNTPDALGSQVVTFRGKNMGFEPSPLTITINDRLCGESEWVSDAQVRCRPPADLVGPKNVSILVANRSEPFTFYDFEEMYISECKYGYYGVRAEVCLPCMRGGVCPGGEQLNDLVISMPGFWRDNLTVPDARCEPERWSRAEHGCPFLSACEPPWSCVGNNVCGEGYEGSRCMFCLKGKYYRVNGECIKCPQSLYAILIGMGLVLLGAAGFAYWLNKKQVSIALVAIGVDYAQVLSMFAKTRIRWPTYLKEIFSILSAFNLNIELTAPECMVPNMQYWQKFSFIELLPFSFFAVFFLIFLFKLGYKWCFLNKTKHELFAHVPTLISTSIIIFRILYLYLTRTSMDVMNCAPTEPPDGHQYMSGMLDMPCWQSGSMQVLLFPFALCCLGLYTLGAPLGLFWFMYRNRQAIFTDQLLRAKDTGNDRISNPRYYEFRKSWSKIYYHFKPSCWFWEMCIFARKAMLSFTSLMFRSTPSYQLALALLILFVAYVAHVRVIPYLTHSDKPKVIAEHIQKAMSDPFHASIEAEMRAVEKKNVRKRVAANVFAVKANQQSFAQAAVLAIFDYNTVEGVLLASAVLTVLAGIMFDSNRFSVDNLPYYQREYDSLTAAVLMLIVGTLIYFFVVFCLDLTLILCPARTTAMFDRCAPRQAKGSQHRRTMISTPQADSGNSSDMMLNPIMLQSQMASKGEQEDSLFTGSGFVDPAHVAGMTGLPTTGMWKAIQLSYSKIADLLEQSQKEVRDAKRKVDSNEHGGAEFGIGKGIRSRRQFAPTVRDTNEGAQSVPRHSVANFMSPASGFSVDNADTPANMTSMTSHNPMSPKPRDGLLMEEPTEDPPTVQRARSRAKLLATFTNPAATTGRFAARRVPSAKSAPKLDDASSPPAAVPDKAAPETN